ncbi:MAG: glutaredoxin 3 [Bdellovibrionaceae bacterium]|nr:glutaredoxin 3 [Pseudobdellovibrionaceae bacterium]|tara:strand:+ start:623 stop:868 length:246 start_codon:yes stop_codon:yes gene_type:complete
MARVKVYTTSYCPYCVRAKQLLSSKGIDFEEVNMDGKTDELKALKEKTGLQTVPQIFIDDELVGGFTELAAKDSRGELQGL